MTGETREVLRFIDKSNIFSYIMLTLYKRKHLLCYFSGNYEEKVRKIPSIDWWCDMNFLNWLVYFTNASSINVKDLWYTEASCR